MAIMSILCCEPYPWTIAEIGSELERGESEVRAGVERLAALECVHRLGHFVFTTRAARRARASGAAGHASHLAPGSAERVPNGGLDVGVGFSDADAMRLADVALTDREREVCALLRARWTDAEIARELRISISTVRSHACNVYRKLGVTGRRMIATQDAVG